MPIGVPATLLGLRRHQLKRFAFTFKVERTDGVTLRLTSHDEPLVVGADTYTPIGSVDVSARRREGSLKEQDIEFRGVLSSSAITNADLLAGRYRDAKVTEQLIDWRYPFAGAFSTSVGWVGKTVFDGEAWLGEVTGLGRWLRARVGDLFNRNCRATLGDAECTVALAGHTTTGVNPVGLMDGEKKRIIRANPAQLSGSFPDNWFQFGKVLFTGGANVGLVGEIRLYTQATREIELQLPMPFEIAVTDVFSITAGCDKRATTCLNKFSNLVNYRGYPYVPGTDAVLKITPSR